MLHSELERTHILNYVCPLLLGTSCTANTQCLVISALLPILSRYTTLAPSLKSILINHPDTTALISPENLFWYGEAFLRTLLVQ